jgi:hypothetical protein
MFLFVLFCFFVLSTSFAFACVVDDDCGLLGICNSSVCDCEPGWIGETCASLNLLPSSPSSGLRQTNSSNWCLSILRDDTNPNLFHAYSADFGGCLDGLKIWLQGSRIIHATSLGTPIGPYTPQWIDGDSEVAVSAEAHNPQAIQAPDGTYLLFDSYGGPDSGCDMMASYSNCSALGGMCTPKMKTNGGISNYVFHYSNSPLVTNTWLPMNVSMDYPCFSENITPSPFFHSNGTLYIVMHCDKGGEYEMGDLVMVRADSWRGPFVRVNSRIWSVANVGPHPEDPFFFIQTNSKTREISWHIILHNTPVGIHLFSRDGLNFTLQQSLSSSSTDAVPQPPYVYPSTINQTDGTSFNADRRERPWILFKNGTTCVPELLVTSMQAPSVFSQVFSHIQEIQSN